MEARTKELYLDDIDNNNLYNQETSLTSDPNKVASGLPFSALNIPRWLLKGIYGYGFNSPSKIQEIMLPILIANPPQNVIAQSQSGTGKTATFSIAMLTRIDAELMEPQCLVVAPTFELSKQIGKVVSDLAKYEPLISVGYALRGEQKPEQGKIFPHQIVIGTPGKLLDYCFKQNVIDLSKLKVFILDEADVMIDLQGHRDTSIRLKSRLSSTCQMILMSATYSQKIASYANIMVKNAKIFRLQRKQECLSNIGQYYFICKNDDTKFLTIKSLYSQISLGQVITFCQTKKTATWLANKMTGMGIKSAVLSGTLDIKQRFDIIEEFRKGHIRSLITTNLTARGIDIEQITMVVNYDFPTHYTTGKADCETYLHRIGRTGRFGKMGIAINLISDDKDMLLLKEIETHFNIKIIRIAMDDDLTTIEPNSDNPNAYANNNDSKENSNEVVPYWGQDVYVIEC